MATRQLTDLPANASGLDTDLYHTRQGATDKSLTGALLKDFVKWLNQDFYTTTGTDTYVATAGAETAVPDDYFDGQTVTGVFNTNTGGAATINAGGLGVKSIKTAAGVDPLASDISGRTILAYDDGNGWFEILQFGGGGPSLGSQSVIRTNAKNIAEDITFAGTENGMTAGPITIDDTFTVTVTSGSTWTVV